MINYIEKLTNYLLDSGYSTVSIHKDYVTLSECKAIEESVANGKAPDYHWIEVR